jgi:hypothetical protein
MSHPPQHTITLILLTQCICVFFVVPTINSDYFPKYSMLCNDRLSVSQSVLVSSTHLVLKIAFLFLSDSCEFVDVGRPIWREDGSVVYCCCWSLPAQLLSGPSPVGLMIIFYCPRFETPPTWRARSPYLHPPETGCPSYTPRHWVTPFLNSIKWFVFVPETKCVPCDVRTEFLYIIYKECSLYRVNSHC